MSNKKAGSEKEIPFEIALTRLEEIATELESGSLGLEDSLKKYEEGIQYARLCQGKLAEAEKKIEILQKNKKGNIEEKNIKIKESSGEIADGEDVQGSLL